MDRKARIESALTAAFQPHRLDVNDESALHAGHAGARDGGQTHYEVVMVSAAFSGLGRLARSRAVHEVLANEFAGGLHALSLKLRAPDE
jgi:BolA protein